MLVNDDKALDLLYDHYKETFSYQRDYIARRDRLFALVLVAVTLMFFHVSDPDQAAATTTSFIEKWTETKIAVQPGFVANLIWFVLLSLVVKYFQVNIHISRQYDYIHGLESRFLPYLGKGVIAREGAAYLEKYPLFSEVAHRLYTWVFPILIICVTLWKMVNESWGQETFDIHFWINASAAFTIWVGTILYLIQIHLRK